MVMGSPGGAMNPAAPIHKIAGGTLVGDTLGGAKFHHGLCFPNGATSIYMILLVFLCLL